MKHYSENEINYLRQNYPVNSIPELASFLNRSKRGIKNKLWCLGLLDKSRWWDATEIEALSKLYSKDGQIDLAGFAKSLGRNKANVSRKARDLGLGTNSHRRKTFEQRCPTSQARIRRQQLTPEEAHEARSFAQRERIKKCGHPRGFRELRICPACGRFFDVKHSSPQQYCTKECSYRRARPVNMYTRSRGGKRKDLDNIYFRSSYEANYARYLKFLIAQVDEVVMWEYEPVTFEFKKIKRGVRFYTPDFRVTFKDGHIEYHEVKGWDYPKGVTARKRMAKYYPHIKLVLVGEGFFKAVRAQGFHRLIPSWE